MVLEDILSITLDVIGTGGVMAKENANGRRIARNLSRITIRSKFAFCRLRFAGQSQKWYDKWKCEKDVEGDRVNTGVRMRM